MWLLFLLSCWTTEGGEGASRRCLSRSKRGTPVLLCSSSRLHIIIVSLIIIYYDLQTPTLCIIHYYYSHEAVLLVGPFMIENSRKAKSHFAMNPTSAPPFFLTYKFKFLCFERQKVVRGTKENLSSLLMPPFKDFHFVCSFYDFWT